MADNACELASGVERISGWACTHIGVITTATAISITYFKTRLHELWFVNVFTSIRVATYSHHS